jgi:ATP-dependent Clp protease protease subunit
MADFNKPKERNLFFSKQVDQESIEKLAQQIIEINDSDEILIKELEIYGLIYTPKPIKIFIDSYGGAAYQLFGMLGIIEKSTTPIHTIVTGMAASAGFLILISGHKRFGYSNCTTLYHQIQSSSSGTIEDISDGLEETKRLQRKVEEIVLSKTKITKSKLKEIYDAKKDWHLDAENSEKFGVIDEII